VTSTPGTTIEGRSDDEVGEPRDDGVPPTEPAAPEQAPGAAGDEFGPVRFVGRVALTLVAVITLSLVVYVTLLSGLEHRAAQSHQFAQFRKALAFGTAPVGQTDSSGKLLAFGTPVALLEIPAIHVKQVVGESTTSEVLTKGPGHRRDTPLPGQAGTSVIMGRQAAFGGPFKHLHDLKPGAKITVVTGLGTSTFKVIDVRHAGDPIPPPLASGAGRLTLITAAGTSFMPRGLVLVDADLTSRPLASAPSVLGYGSLQSSERANAGDTSTLWALVFWLEALVLVAVGTVWSWQRWGHYQTWIVFFPLTAVVGYFVSDQFVRLLPNLL
jgi:LPXTG-site transpeptidase (sortase) family protein